MTALHSQPYKDAIERVIRRRIELGWSQEELARRLPRYEKPTDPDQPSAAPEKQGGQPQSYVSKFEQRERRLDVTEFEHVCHALGMRVADAIEEHKWNGEPPPRVVPLAQDPHLSEHKLGQRRIKPGRKPHAATVDGATVAEPVQAEPAAAQPASWPQELPMGGASQSVEAPGHEQPRAADSPTPPEADLPARNAKRRKAY